MTLAPGGTTEAGRFPLERLEGEPGELVGATAAPSGRLARLVHPRRRALVLGSAQPDADVDRVACAAAGVVVARRRSGGGAVLVGPGEQVWLDVFVPAGDPLFDADVSRAAWWLGRVWAAALAEAGERDVSVHEGAMRAGPFGRRACFAGLGPGEVSVAGRKLVGISQRRDRRGAWLFTMALRGGPAGPGPAASLTRLLALPGNERRELLGHLEETTTTLGVPAERVEAALVASLAGAERLRQG